MRTPRNSTLIVKLAVFSGVYSYCYYNDSFNATLTRSPDDQQIRLKKEVAKALNQSLPQGFNASLCSYFDGIFNYFNINNEAYHAKFKREHKWNGPCVFPI
jgi:hypothetical protein